MTITDTLTLAATTVELRRLLDYATPGEWWQESCIIHAPLPGNGATHPVKTHYDEDADLIVALHNHAPALLDAVDALTAERDRQRREIALIRADAERIRSWGTGLHADQDGSLSCILYHCDVALSPSAPVAERDGDG